MVNRKQKLRGRFLSEGEGRKLSSDLSPVIGVRSGGTDSAFSIPHRGAVLTVFFGNGSGVFFREKRKKERFHLSILTGGHIIDASSTYFRLTGDFFVMFEKDTYSFFLFSFFLLSSGVGWGGGLQSVMKASLEAL